MNQNGEFFAGFYRGWFKWSINIAEAKEIDTTAQYSTIRRHEPLMDMVCEYV